MLDANVKEREVFMSRVDVEQHDQDVILSSIDHIAFLLVNRHRHTR